MQYNATFNGSGNVIFQLIINDIFLISAPDIDCGGSNEYPQSACLSQNKKKLNLTYPYIKWGYIGCSLHGLVYVMNQIVTEAVLLLKIVNNNLLHKIISLHYRFPGKKMKIFLGVFIRL